MNLLYIKFDRFDAGRRYEGNYMQQVGINKQNKNSTFCKTSINQLEENSFTVKIK